MDAGLIATTGSIGAVLALLIGAGKLLLAGKWLHISTVNLITAPMAARIAAQDNELSAKNALLTELSAQNRELLELSRLAVPSLNALGKAAERGAAAA